MDENIVREMLHELFTSLEALETQSSAITQFLKDKGITNEEELAPYLERAGNASNVRWLGARVKDGSSAFFRDEDSGKGDQEGASESYGK
jgi:hypothetical protein